MSQHKYWVFLVIVFSEIYKLSRLKLGNKVFLFLKDAKKAETRCFSF